MNAQNALSLRLGGSVLPSTCVSVPTVANVSPQFKTGVLTPDSPRNVPDSAFNSFTPKDVIFLQSFKHSDSLHRSDSLASEQSRGTRLKSWIKENGVAKFNSLYNLH